MLAARAFAGGASVLAEGVNSAVVVNAFDPAEAELDAEKDEVAPVPVAPEDAFD